MGVLLGNKHALGFGGSVKYDRYVNANLGSDDNDGTSPSKAWATLFKLTIYSQNLTDGDQKTAYVATGDYSSFSYGTKDYSSLTKLTITFQTGCKIIGTGVDYYSGINISTGGANFHLFIIGNGLTIQDFLVSSGNGIASSAPATALIDVDNVIVTNCDDGVSAHGASKIIVRNSTFQNCTKSAWAHINTTQCEHYNCTFIGRTGASVGIGSNTSTNRQKFYNCTFVPIAADQSVDISLCDLYNCKIGTSSLRANANGINSTLTNCYLNINIDFRFRQTWLRCYGLVTSRIRGDDAGTPISLVKNCVIVGNASGKTNGFLYGNYDALDGTWDGYPVDIKDSVIMNFATAIGAGFSTNQKTTFSASSFVRYCNLYNNTTDIATGITCGSNNIDVNPVLGSYSGSTEQSDYAVTAAECIGTGSDGGNIGFTINDI